MLNDRVIMAGRDNGQIAGYATAAKLFQIVISRCLACRSRHQLNHAAFAAPAAVIRLAARAPRFFLPVLLLLTAMRYISMPALD